MFTFAPTGATASLVSKAKASVYGSTVEIDVSPGTAIFDALTSQIFYPATTPQKTFAIRDVRSDEFQPAGQAKIGEVAWALPVAMTSPNSFGTASGSGSLAIRLNSGITVAWKGQTSPLQTADVVLFV